MNCPNCNRENRPSAKICGYCGRPLPRASAEAPYGPTVETPAPDQATGWSQKNMLLAGLVLIVVVGALSLVAYFLLQPSGNQAALAATATRSAQKTATARAPTLIASGLSITSTESTLAPVPITPIWVEGKLPAIAGTKRLDISGTSRNIVNITDVVANKSFSLFKCPGQISGMVFSAAWAPDGKRILLSYNWKSGDYDYGHVIATVNEDGSNPTEIIRTAPSGEGVMAAFAYRDAIWSPDGTRIAVRYQYGNDFGIWLANANGTGSKRLASSEIGDWPRFWSVDGQWVIGESSSDGRMYAVRVDGAERVAFEKIKGIKMFDERQFPWRTTDEIKCTATGTWFSSGGSYWDCE
jgi:hypothetical protein